MILDSLCHLKITDFGEAEVFQSPYENAPHKSKKCCGSEPYMAPEEFKKEEFDPRLVDIFACGIIYLVLVNKRLPWKIATLDDPVFKEFSKRPILSQCLSTLPSSTRYFIFLEIIGSCCLKCWTLILKPALIWKEFVKMNGFWKLSVNTKHTRLFKLMFKQILKVLIIFSIFFNITTLPPSDVVVPSAVIRTKWAQKKLRH